MDGQPRWTDCDEAGDYVVPNVLSPRDLTTWTKLYHSQVTPMSAVWMCPRSNPFDLLCMSMLPATLIMIQSEMNKLVWYYNSMRICLDTQEQLIQQSTVLCNKKVIICLENVSGN